MFLIFSQQTLFSQIVQIPSTSDSLNESNEILIGAEKLVSTYLFTGRANIAQEFFGGKLRIFQSYRGSSIRSLKSNFRDDELFRFQYDYPVYKKLFVIARQNWLYSWDSKDIILNKYERFNGSGGLKLDYFNNSSAEFTIGADNTKQVGIKSTGTLFAGKANLSDFNLSEFIINSAVNGEYTKLDFNRINSNLDARASMIRTYDSTNTIGMNVRYKMLNGDYFNPPQGNISSDFSFENRYQKRLTSDLNLNFSFTNFLLANLMASYNIGTVSREYKNIIDSIPITKVRKLINENQLLLLGEVKFVFSSFSQNLGMSIETSSEKNTLEKKREITPTEEQYLKATEFYPDFSSARTRLFARTKWNISKKDIFLFDYSASLYQYDTPSKENDDDKDEFSTLATAVYSRKMSDILSASLRAEVILNHIVFLKAAKSSQNAWNRIIRFSPQFNVDAKGFSMQPQFEVLANYTDYDYSQISQTLRDYTSLRQIGYRDSIFVSLGDGFNLQSRIILRYSERGILFWKEFAESPQNSNFEQFSKLLLFVNMNNNILIGVGGRYYNISQGSLNRVGGNKGIPDYVLQSYGPEALVRVVFSSGSEINFQGWYDFQLINKKEKLDVPNFLIQTSIKM